eukprot:364589-Chlamydomonas_euryale.AAC.16
MPCSPAAWGPAALVNPTPPRSLPYPPAFRAAAATGGASATREPNQLLLRDAICGGKRGRQQAWIRRFAYWPAHPSCSTASGLRPSLRLQLRGLVTEQLLPRVRPDCNVRQGGGAGCAAGSGTQLHPKP